MRDRELKNIIWLISGQSSILHRLWSGILLIFNARYRKEYKELKALWQDMGKYNPHRLDSFKSSKIRNDWSPYIKIAIAASIVILIGLYILALPKAFYIKNSTCKIAQVTLPDNSVIVLDTGATLIYKKSLLLGFNRKVTFSGQGFFHVAKHNGQPFIVNCNNLYVRVLGTKFNIKTHAQQTTVTLVNGKVEVFGFKTLDTSIYMHPSELVQYSSKTGQVKVKTTNPAIQTFWMQHTIKFNNYSLQEISEIFKTYYGKNLTFDDSILKYKHIGGSAPNDNWLLIIKALSYIIHSQYIIHNDTIILKQLNK